MEADADKTFYTATMARVLSNQGKYAEAARIYHHLLEQTPDDADLRKALDTLAPLVADEPSRWNEVATLVEQWVRLMLGQKVLRQYQKCKPPSAGIKR